MTANNSVANQINGPMGGRPIGSKSLISRAMVAHVCLKNFRKHVKVLESIIANPDSGSQARISAIVVLWERGLGKVPQAVTGADGGAVTLQLVTSVVQAEDYGANWDDTKAIAAPIATDKP